jgi:hypothetical protein
VPSYKALAVIEAAVVGAAVGCVGPGLYQSQPNRIAPGAIDWIDLPSAVVKKLVGSDNAARDLINVLCGFTFPTNFLVRLVD